MGSVDARGSIAGRGARRGAQALAYGDALKIGDVTVTIVPAGHVLGSAQAVIEWKGSRAVVSGARAAIEAARDHINDQNVYPVPDGDTGTNLALTVAAVDDALAAAGDGGPAEVAALVRRSALMGGRGNSGR